MTGDVTAPATLELPTGGSLETVREAVSLDSQFKMACVGGQFGGVTRSLDQTPSAPALTGAHLGTDGVVELFDQSRCAVATAGHAHGSPKRRTADAVFPAAKVRSS